MDKVFLFTIVTSNMKQETWQTNTYPPKRELKALSNSIQFVGKCMLLYCSKKRFNGLVAALFILT